MELRIKHQFPQVGIKIQNAAINTHTTQPHIQLDRSAAVLEIESPRPRIHIDQSQCFADAGLKSPQRFTDDQAAQGKSAALEATARKAAEGHQLAQINGTSVADIAKSHSQKQVRITVKAVPQKPPEIYFEISQVRMNYQPAEIKVSAQRGELQSDYQPGVVEIYEQQKALLEISWVGDTYDSVA